MLLLNSLLFLFFLNFQFDFTLFYLLESHVLTVFLTPFLHVNVTLFLLGTLHLTLHLLRFPLLQRLDKVLFLLFEVPLLNLRGLKHFQLHPFLLLLHPLYIEYLQCLLD